ncbi:MAG TPA: 2-isopropylmalate synthase [Acidimicrobiia bacterium]|nr:2-isopropylmalate synthase [Acidimicrobiia bacterium]
MPNQVKIFDSTLRDGEQAPGIALDPDQKVMIASQLAKLGVDIIEAGFPIASPGDFQSVKRIAQEVQGPTIAALARAQASDVDRAWEAIRYAADPRLHVFMATSPIHMQHKLRMSEEEVITAVKANVGRAREHTENVEYSPEDATRSDPDFVISVCASAVDAGATTVNIPDTVGYATPSDYAALIGRVVKEVRGDRDDIVVSTHCHNDLGLAVANSLAAVEAGARQVEGAINGIGERAGNTSIEEVVMALSVRNDNFGVEVGVNTEEIYETSRLVAEQTGYPIQYNKAVVGRNAFAHESGIHQHGVLSERSTYEIMDPMAVGMGRSLIVMGKHSGRAAFKHSLAEIGIDLNGTAFEKAFTRMKDVADHVGEVSQERIRLIVEEVVSGVEVLDGVSASFE